MCGSARAVIRELSDPATWAKAAPRRRGGLALPPERRLAESISRSQYLRGRDRYLAGAGRK